MWRANKVSVMSGFTLQSHPVTALSGSIRVPGDKSISHRALMLAALADGDSEIDGFLHSDDCLATANALRILGVSIEFVEQDRVLVRGAGRRGFDAADVELDLGNSGTSIRLLSGLLVARPFASTLTGDRSLNMRPMKRITAPLRMMGADIKASPDGTPPLVIKPCQGLQGISYTMPISSAQVKSCLLLAGLYARGWTTLTEPMQSRDHTERMLRAFSYPVSCEQNRVSIEGGAELTATRIEVPGDISSAMFFIVAACIIKGSRLTIENVGVNPTRIGAIDILRSMGAAIEIKHVREVNGEPISDIEVEARDLHGVNITPEQVPAAIDEFPILFIAAACAKGRTCLRGAKELRVKESDRINTMTDGLMRCGVRAEIFVDGLVIEGGRLSGGVVDAVDDHRVAMAFSVAGSIADSPVTVKNCAGITSSFPNFNECANRAGMHIE